MIAAGSPRRAHPATGRGTMPVLSLILLLAAVPGEDMRPESTVIDFRDEPAEWYVVNDGVMGGISRGGIVRTDEGTGLFRGRLSLEYNGGFASVRTVIDPIDPARADGLEIRVRGDGRTYQLRLRTDDGFDGVAYRAEFATEPDTWTTTRIAFVDFAPTFRGRILRDVDPLDPARIRQLGFLLADKKAGEFALEIDRVRTWRNGEEE